MVILLKELNYLRGYAPPINSTCANMGGYQTKVSAIASTQFCVPKQIVALALSTPNSCIAPRISSSRFESSLKAWPLFHLLPWFFDPLLPLIAFLLPPFLEVLVSLLLLHVFACLYASKTVFPLLLAFCLGLLLSFQGL